MSARRAYVDGHPVWVTENDGAVGRISYSRIGIRGGGPPVITGAFVTGESAKTIEERKRREWNANRDLEVKAAADHSYYLRNKAAIMAKQRERRRLR